MQFDFKAIVDEANLAVLIFDSKTRKFAYTNLRGDELIALSRVSPPTFFLDHLFVDTPKGNLRCFDNTLLEASGDHLDILVKKLDGSVAITNLGVRVMNSNEGEYTVLIIQDVTFQHKLKREVNMKQAMLRNAYDELLEQNNRLLALDQAKDRFIALVTHELRTPLSAIVATIDVLMLDLYDDPAQQKDFIKMVHEQSLLLQALVNDILDFAKIQAGKMEYFVEYLDLRALLNKQAEHYRQMAQDDNIELNVEYSGRDNFYAYFDQLRMTEVINNILSNAIKYNRKGGKIFIGLESANKEHLLLTVRDTGRGIPEDKIPHVFNEFETIGAINHHHKGTGLGMPICKRLVEAMGGQIYIESTLNVGTTFFVKIPKDKILAHDVYRSRSEFNADLVAS